MHLKFLNNDTGRVKSFKSRTEPLTPGALYVLTSTLFGTVLARSSILLRFTLPPALFFASAFRFLPETSTNISNYIYDLEKQHVPELARIQTDVSKGVKSSWQAAHNGWSAGRESVQVAVQKSAGWLENVTGLKVHDVFGVVRHTGIVVKERADDDVQALKEKAEKVLEKLEKRVK